MDGTLVPTDYKTANNLKILRHYEKIKEIARYNTVHHHLYLTNIISI